MTQNTKSELNREDELINDMFSMSSDGIEAGLRILLQDYQGDLLKIRRKVFNEDSEVIHVDSSGEIQAIPKTVDGNLMDVTAASGHLSIVKMLHEEFRFPLESSSELCAMGEVYTNNPLISRFAESLDSEALEYFSRKGISLGSEKNDTPNIYSPLHFALLSYGQILFVKHQIDSQFEEIVNDEDAPEEIKQALRGEFDPAVAGFQVLATNQAGETIDASPQKFRRDLENAEKCLLLIARSPNNLNRHIHAAFEGNLVVPLDGTSRPTLHTGRDILNNLKGYGLPDHIYCAFTGNAPRQKSEPKEP